MDPWLLGGSLNGFPVIWHLSSDTTLDHSPKDYYYDLNDRRCHVAPNDFRKLRHPAKDIPREAMCWLLSLEKKSAETQALISEDVPVRMRVRLSLGRACVVAWRQKRPVDACVRVVG